MAKDSKPRSQKAKYYTKKGKGSKENEQAIKGPGIFLSCIRGKEHLAVFEAYDLLNQLADRLYPSSPPPDHADMGEGAEPSIEEALQAELAEMQKPRSAGGQRFQSRKTQTDCMAFISVAPPCDPVLLVQEAVKELLESKIVKSKFILRMTPVTATCSAANLGEVESLAKKVLGPVFRPLGAMVTDEPVTWKLALNIRSHNTLSRLLLMPAFVGLVQNLVMEAAPVASTSALDVDAAPSVTAAKRRSVKTSLDSPDKVVIVEILRSVCGISVVDGELYEGEGKRFGLDAISSAWFKPEASAADVSEPTVQAESS